MKFQNNQDLPIYELKINESLNDESEVSYVALVDLPAIKKDFLAFKEGSQEFINPSKGEDKTEFLPRCISYVINEGKPSEQAVAICNSIWEEHFAEGVKHYTQDGKLWTGPTHKDSTGRLMTGATHTKDSEYLYHEGEYAEGFAESYNDYPKQASENAQIALNYAEKNGWGDCGTPVGKIRANQLAKGEPISRDTIARMSAFERHRQNSQRDLGDGCGRLMWLAWGGDAGVEWATRKLNQIDTKLSTKKKDYSFQIISEDEHIISGPLMLADQLIYRDNEKFGEHYVKFSPDTIKDIAIKFAKRKYQSNVNLMHDPSQVVEGVTMFESFIVDKKRGVLPMAGFEDVADGSWFGSFYVENNEVWNQVKSGELRGFSVEGLFDYDEPKKQLSPEEQALKKIEELLKEIN